MTRIIVGVTHKAVTERACCRMNVFRYLADGSHLVSKCILIWAIHWNKSAEGVSLLTQCLYVVVFISRYLDLFDRHAEGFTFLAAYNFGFKVFYIFSSIYIVLLMVKLLWTFSIILESVCVLPQLLLLRQTTIPTVIDSYYLLALGSYRGLYILNWIYRGATEHFFDPISVVFGVIQTLLYVDFAWIYWSRQRVKLRGGGIIDSEDIGRGLLLRRIISHGRGSFDEEAGQLMGDGMMSDEDHDTDSDVVHQAEVHPGVSSVDPADSAEGLHVQRISR
ncbi:hypothetical protein BZG36_03736 [Bifiguratus adelaidae]|uniref:ER lumen protein-retaining receptor n=1 Tax=Bifiguratus adelaidae TaxID=1938954 RepID=A0A261XZ49_9FUNG|nr:hypothetical protein BZG36_03736 [Bifiguratus adelaidae]